MDSRSLYNAVWRWHFIAGLLVLPFLVMMAITGGAYLFRPELDHMVYRPLEDVAPRPAALAAPSVFIPRVEAGLHGRVLEFTPAGPLSWSAPASSCGGHGAGRAAAWSAYAGGRQSASSGATCTP